MTRLAILRLAIKSRVVISIGVRDHHVSSTLSLFQVGKEFDALLIDTKAPATPHPVFDVFEKDTMDVSIGVMHVCVCLSVCVYWTHVCVCLSVCVYWTHVCVCLSVCVYWTHVCVCDV